MSRQDELLRLVDLYSCREVPKSGVVSRSRLRSWLGEHTDVEGLWEPFIEALIERGLWQPWDGDDLRGTREQRPSTYRDAGNDARVFASPRPPPVGYAAAALGGLGFMVFMLTNPPSVGSPAFGAFFCVFVIVSGFYYQIKHGRPELSVVIDNGLLHLKRESESRTLPLRDIEWVDVEWQGIPYLPPGKSHYDKNRFGVVARLRSGERVVLVDCVVRDVALKVCRAIETSIETPKPRIRIDATVIEEHELDDADTEPNVIVDATLYEAGE